MKGESNVDKIFNDGERLVPFLSHEEGELIRHFSSHNFFRNIITHDIEKLKLKDLSILDLGFGAGYASYIYSRISQVASVHGIDVAKDSLDWVLENFSNEKIKYEIIDAVKFLARKDKYDYIVTRHVLEHIEDGLNIVKENKYSRRLCISVPYNEGEGNKWHILKGIVEESFPSYSNVEFFYEDLEGNIYLSKPKSIQINSIIFIASKDDMPKISSYFSFPYKTPELRQLIHYLTDGNPRFTENVIEMQSHRYRSLLSTSVDYQLACKQLEVENKELKKEISSIRNSKKWRYSKKIADLKDKIVRNGKAD